MDEGIEGEPDKPGPRNSFTAPVVLEHLRLLSTCADGRAHDRDPDRPSSSHRPVLSD